jgi:hypothetical protein
MAAEECLQSSIRSRLLVAVKYKSRCHYLICIMMQRYVVPADTACCKRYGPIQCVAIREQNISTVLSRRGTKECQLPYIKIDSYFSAVLLLQLTPCAPFCNLSSEIFIRKFMPDVRHEKYEIRGTLNRG